MKKIKVLSLFNGMNCIGLALHSLGIEFELYASEIDKYANKVSNTLFPDTIELGDVIKIDIDSLPIFDLVVGGSPCQGFSFAGKQLNFDDERSKLFFDFVKILDACKNKNPNVKFLLENVKMKSEHEAVISRFVGIDPIEINSALLSAQNRRRLYWTNIGTVKANLFGIEEPGIKQPKNKGVLLNDILEDKVSAKYNITNNWQKFVTDPARLKKKYTQIDGEKAITMTARQYASWCGDFVKCAALRGRYNESGIIEQNLEPRQDNKTNCLTSVQKDNYLIVPEATKIRRLTPLECMRLQTVPEWAIEKMLNCGVSDSQLYKMLGNGWTVDVIAYILGHEYK